MSFYLTITYSHCKIKIGYTKNRCIMSKKIAISKFKSHCLEIIDNLQHNHQSIIITKRDKVVAKVIPFKANKTSIFGFLKGKAEIKGDIISSLEEEWDAEK